MHWLLLLLLLGVWGCERTKSFGPAAVLPESGTSLYFVDCPAYYTGEVGSLTPNIDGVAGNDCYLYGSEVTWRSNAFFDLPGTVTEGFRLQFERDQENADDTTGIDVTFAGLGGTLTRHYVMAIGESFVIFEDSQTELVEMGADSGKVVSISIEGYGVRLVTDEGNGSFLRIGVERANLCEFAVDAGPGVVSSPNETVELTYLDAPFPVNLNLYRDFAGGTTIADQSVTLGPDFGIAYVIAASGPCLDTVAIYSAPPESEMGVDTLDISGNALTDGQSVWPYTIEYEFVDPDYVQHVIVRNSSGSIIIERTFQQDYSSYATLLYDQMNDLIWLIVRDYQRADTAWGYDGQGDLDSVVITTTIPSGVLVSGWWITSEEDGYLRYVYATPFAGGATEHVGDVPTALTTAGFFGRAGVTVPDEPFEDWHINVFSAEGNWLARYPVRDRSGSGGEVYSVTIMAADSVIIYLAGISTGSEWRVIRP